MAKIYRVSGLQNSGSASALARTISAIHLGLKVKIDPEHGIVDVRGTVSDFLVADAVKKSGCTYLGVEDRVE